MSARRSALLAFATVLALTPGAYPQPQAEHARAEQRLARIRRECLALGPHDWAGQYRCELYSVLWIAPDAGCAAFGDESLQYAYVINHGDVARFADGVLALKLAIQPSDYPRPPDRWMVYAQQYVSEEMIVIPWAKPAFSSPRTHAAILQRRERRPRHRENVLFPR